MTGTAGSDAKCAMLVEKLGCGLSLQELCVSAAESYTRRFDAAINYKS
eukprot:SAG31_NODE_27243_length_429_cov_0.921212_1_plen_47_part_10